MLEGVIERTVTGAMAGQQNGSLSKQTLADAIDAAVERHGAEWEQNLVSSWSTLGSTELEQVCTALREGDQSTFMQFTQRLGPEVRTRNEPLLKRAGEDVIKVIWSAEE